jgi:hypothetical protein
MPTIVNSPPGFYRSRIDGCLARVGVRARQRTLQANDSLRGLLEVGLNVVCW